LADNKLSLIVSFTGNDKLSGAIKTLIGLGKSGDQALKGMFKSGQQPQEGDGQSRQTDRQDHRQCP
jgi:membrane protease subunit (stomatin/prohibitin family)